jgi:hypothetical protein
VKEMIQKSIVQRKAVVNTSDATTVAGIEAVAAESLPAAIESSCESLGSKGKYHGAPDAEVVHNDVLSFEQRRKEILRMTRQAEERKKRFVAWLMCETSVLHA